MSAPDFTRWDERGAITSAVMAFLALSAEGKREMVSQYNAFQAGRAHPDSLSWDQHPKNGRANAEGAE